MPKLTLILSDKQKDSLLELVLECRPLYPAWTYIYVHPAQKVTPHMMQAWFCSHTSFRFNG